MARTRPQLPRLVDQMRILIWFQFHLTLVTLLVAIGVGAIIARHTVVPGHDDRLARVEVLMLTLAGTGFLLGFTAALVRRGFLVAFPLVLLAEAGVAVDVVLAVRAGIVLAIPVAILVGFGAWVLVDLFRGQVRAFLLGRAVHH